MKKFIFTAILIVCFSLVGTAQNGSKQIQKAGELLSKGNINGAIAALDKAVKNNEGSFEVYKMRSSLYGMIGNLQAEFNDLSKAIELKSTDGELYQRRAQARMFLRHDNSLIISDLDSAIANGRKIEKVYNLRAMFRFQNGDREGALSDYQTAVGLNPDSAGSIIGLAGIYRFSENTPQAILILENFLSRYENSSNKLPTVKGRVVAKKDAIVVKEENMVIGSESVIIVNDDDDGTLSPEQLRKQTEILENTKNTAQVYSMLAELYNERGDGEKALEMIGKALTIDPTNTQNYGVRGAIKTSLKDYDGAYEDLTRAINASPSFPFNYADRGILLLMMNKDDAAQNDFDKFYEIVSHPNARKNLEKRIADAKKLREKIY